MSKNEIKSPIPGVFYRKPSPDAEPFKKDGAPVSVGDVVGLIEVMKSFHEIKSEKAGSSIVFTLEDGAEIMAGQTIAEISE